MLGLAFTCSTWSGVAAMICIHRLGDDPERHPLEAAGFDDLGGVATLGPDDFEQVGDLAGNRTADDQVDDTTDLGSGNR